MLVHSSYDRSLEEIDSLCQAGPDTPLYHGIPPLMLSRCYTASKHNNFLALLIGRQLVDAYPRYFENTNLFVRILRDTLHSGELYADKQAILDEYAKHSKSVLRPRTIADASRIGLHPLLIKALDMADGGLVDIVLSDTRSVKSLRATLCKTAEPDCTYTGSPRVSGTDADPIISIGTQSIHVLDTNLTTLETKFGQTAKLIATQPAKLTIQSGNVIVETAPNYRQSSAIDYLVREADKRTDTRLYASNLIYTLAHKTARISTPDIAEYMTLRAQLSDVAQGFTHGYIVNPELTDSPVSSDLYIRCLSTALEMYSIISSETFNIDIDDQPGQTTEDSVSAKGVHS